MREILRKKWVRSAMAIVLTLALAVPVSIRDIRIAKADGYFVGTPIITVNTKKVSTYSTEFYATKSVNLLVDFEIASEYKDKVISTSYKWMWKKPGETDLEVAGEAASFTPEKSDLTVGTHEFTCSVEVKLQVGDKAKTISPKLDGVSIVVSPKEVKDDDVTLYNIDDTPISSKIMKTYDGTVACDGTIIAKIDRGVISDNAHEISGTAVYKSADVGITQVVFTPAAPDSINYVWASSFAKETVGEITKATPVTPVKPEFAVSEEASVTDTTVTLKSANTPLSDGSSVMLDCEYGKQTGSSGEIFWQDSPAFTGLTRHTAYTFYQRAKEKLPNTGVSETSPGLAVTTKTTSLVGATVTLSSASTTYNGTDVKPTVTSVKLKNTGETVDSDQYATKYYKLGENNSETPVSEIIDAGQYRVRAVALSDKDFDASSYADFTVNKCPISSAQITAVQTGELYYTGEALTPTLTVKFTKGTGTGGAKVTLKAGVDYELPTDWTGPGTGVGTGTITITGKGTNFDGSRSDVSVTVNQRKLENNMYTIKGVTNGQTEKITDTTATAWYQSIVIEPVNTAEASYDIYVTSDKSTISGGTHPANNKIEWTETTSKTGSTKHFYLKHKTTGEIYALTEDETKKGEARTFTAFIDNTPPTGTLKVGTPETSGTAAKWSDAWTAVQTSIAVESKWWVTNKKDTNRDQIQITAADNTDDGGVSGIQEIKYFIDEKESGDLTLKTEAELKALAESAWTTTYTSEPVQKITEGKHQIIYVRITDKAGNKAYLSSNLIWSDVVAPTFPPKYEGDKDNPYVPDTDDDLTDTKAKILVKATDEGGTGVTTYKLHYSTTESDVNTKTAVESRIPEKTFTGTTAEFSLTGLTALTKYYFSIVAVDKAGNENFKYGGFFETKANSITKGTFNLDPMAYTYTGAEIKPGDHLTVTYPGVSTPLEKGIDYDIEYHNNVDVASSTDTVHPCIKVTGKGDYSGVQEVPFSIIGYDWVKDEENRISVTPTAELFYTGDTPKTKFVVKMKLPDSTETTLVEGTDYTIDEGSYTMPTSGGNGVGDDASVVLIGKKNLIGALNARKKVTFTVKQQALVPSMFKITGIQKGNPVEISSDNPAPKLEDWYQSVIIEPKEPDNYEIFEARNASGIPAPNPTGPGDISGPAKVTINSEDNNTKYFYLRKKSDDDSEKWIYSMTTDAIGMTKGTARGISAKIDNTPPTGSIQVLNSAGKPIAEWKSFVTSDQEPTDPWYTKEENEIGFTVEDPNGSGEGQVQYIISDKRYTTTAALEKAVTEWTIYSAATPPKVQPNQAQIIYAKLSDAVGNITYRSSEKFYHDNVAPDIPATINGKANPIVTSLGETSATITVKATDYKTRGNSTSGNGSGVDKYWFMYSTDESEITKQAIKYAENNNNTTGVITWTGLQPNTKYYYGIFATDKAGNEGAGSGLMADIVKGSFTTDSLVLKDCEIELMDSTVTYNGAEQKPGLKSIIYDHKPVTFDPTKYTLSYTNNEKAGTAVVTVKAETGAEFKGETTTTFTIKPYNISSDPEVRVTDATSPANKELWYTGSAITPKLTLMFRKGNASTADYTMRTATDYEITYSKQPESGGSGVGTDGEITIEGKGNFTGTRVESFTVRQKQLTDQTTTTTDPKHAMYNVQVQKSAGGSFEELAVNTETIVDKLKNNWYVGVKVMPSTTYEEDETKIPLRLYAAPADITAIPVKDAEAQSVLPANQTELQTGAQTIDFYMQDYVSGRAYVYAVTDETDESLKLLKKGSAKQLAVKIDKTGPKGTIEIAGKTWNDLNQKDTLGLKTHILEPITISGVVDEHSGLAESGAIEYYIGDKMETSVTNLNNISESKWTTYDDTNKPTLEKNKTQYIYVRLKDKLGNTTYLSTQKIINDATMKNANIELSENEFIYNGAKQVPMLKVTMGSGSTATELTKDVDYTVAITSTDGGSGADRTSAGTNIGTVTLTISGVDGKYEGQTTATYRIKARELTATLELSDSTKPVSKVYDGTTSCEGKGADGNSAVKFTLKDAAGEVISAGVSVKIDEANHIPAYTYATKNVATGIEVEATGLELEGTAAGNYTLTSTKAKAAIGEITPATATLGIVAEKKEYNKEFGDDPFSIREAINYEGVTVSGTTKEIPDGTLKYRPEDTSVVTVSETGTVTIKKVGEVKIYVSAEAGNNYKAIAEDTTNNYITIKVGPTDKLEQPASPRNVNLDTVDVKEVTLPAGWQWDDPKEEEAAMTPPVVSKDTLLGDGASVVAVAVYTAEDKDNYKEEKRRAYVTINKVDHNHEPGEVLYTGTRPNGQPETAPDCTHKGYGHIECKWPGCHEIMNPEVEVPALGHDWIHRYEPPTYATTGAEWDECSRCHTIREGSMKTIPKLVAPTPAPAKTLAPIPTIAPDPGGGGSGGGGSGGGGSGGGGSGGGGSGGGGSGGGGSGGGGSGGGGSGGDSSPAPSGAPTGPPSVTSAPTVPPAASSTPSTSSAPSSSSVPFYSQEPIATATPKTVTETKVETNQDENGNTLSTTTTTTEKKGDGTQTVTVTTEYKDGSSTMEMTRTDPNGDVTTVKQEIQKNGNYVKTTTTIPVDGDVTIMRSTGNGSVTTVATYTVTKDGGLQLVSTGTDSANEKVVIPDTLTSDGVSYPITSIKNDAYNGRTKLTGVSVGNNVVNIGSGAFANTPNLKTAILGSSVRKLGSNAFNGAVRLKTIRINSTKLTSIGKGAFSGISPKATIYIVGSKKQFKAMKKRIRASGISKSVKYRRIKK